MLTLILSASLTNPTALDLQEGDIVRKRLSPHKNKSYLSDVPTERARANAATAVDEVCLSIDRDIGRTQDGFAREVFDFIKAVRNDTSATLEQKIATLQAVGRR